LAPDVLILGAAGEWSGSRLERAFGAIGLVAARQSFDAVGFAPGGIDLGPPVGLPGAVLVRSIPAGSFEQVTLRLGLLHALEALGVAVVNGARTIERCVDKGMTSFLLAAAGLPTPPAWTVESEAAARAIVASETAAGHELVLKPLFGSQGRGLLRLAAAEDLPPAETVAGVWHLQRFVGRQADWEDFRVLVVGDRAIAAMRRRGLSWTTNIRQGGRPEPVALTPALAEPALAAARAVGADYAGVDLIEDAAGRLQILEVNSNPAWQGLQSVAEIDIAAEIARLVARKVGSSST
jgi:RimK family alpha-L-glutamate ligase